MYYKEYMTSTTFDYLTISPNGFIKLYGDYANNPYQLVEFDDTIEFLLKKYKKVIITNKFLHIIKNLPDYITDLVIHYRINNDGSNESIEKDMEALNSLPNGLKVLIIRCEDSYPFESFNKPLDNLPPSLERLDIISEHFNCSLDYLPLSLKYLTISSNKFTSSLNNLPPGLEMLSIDIQNTDLRHYTQIPLDNLMNLPIGIKAIELRYNKLKKCNKNDTTIIIKEKLKNRYPNAINIEVF